MAASAERITARSFPTPNVVKVTNNPAAWDQVGGFAAVQAAEANAALAVLDARLAEATSPQERVAAFETAFQHVTEWRHQVAMQGQWTRPGADAEDVRTPIESSMMYRLSPHVGGREVGSPAHRMLTELEQTALDRFGESGDELQNQVRLRDGRTVNGNLLRRNQFGGSEVLTVTAAKEDREVLRRAAFEALGELETQRAAGATPDPQDPGQRQAFIDAAYCLVQGPEMKRGSDAIMRTFLVAAHTRVFDAAPVLPQGIDLDGMVRGQDGFTKVMQTELQTLPRSQAPAPGRTRDGISAGLDDGAQERRTGAAHRSGGLTR
ncbi:hypothetical protein AB0L70_20370 [Kribbella sp. NPDC051952]|uniref:hypothetical protein n=1 Tax=Kribbella sp. NPDC051952 TaxID=3154851 RepID=UPI003426A906